MHGRKKTAIKYEEEKLKRLIQLVEKINILNVDKRKEIYNINNFETSTFLVDKCPLIQTLWNYRKEYFEYQRRRLQHIEKIETTKAAENEPVTDTKREGVETENEDRKEENEEKVKQEVTEKAEQEKTEEEKTGEEKKQEETISKNWTMQELKEQIIKENNMVEQNLKHFLKSYELWFHKLWIVKFSLKNNIMNVNDLYKELEFCKNCFVLDDRNFHCWHYRSYILSCIQICSNNCLKKECISSETTTNEGPVANSVCLKDIVKGKSDSSFDVFQENYDLSTTLINKNFSNFSAWFLKYSLNESYININEELELMKNAVFTDPYDQTIWQYYNWFMFHRGNEKEQIWFTLLREKEIYFFFPNLVKLLIPKCKCYNDNDMEINGSWERQAITFDNENIPPESFVYIFKIDKDTKLEEMKHIKFVLYYFKYNIYHPDKINYENNILQDLFEKKESSLEENIHEYTIHHEIDLNKFLNENTKFEFLLYVNENCELATGNVSSPTKVNEYFKLYDYINRAKKKWSLGKCIDFSLLQRELEQINELLAFEKSCKFALLNKLVILKTIDKYDEALEVLDVLKRVDRFRVNYYKEEEVEIKMKKKLHEYYLHLHEMDDPVLDLRNFCIEDIVYPFFIEAFFVPRINLSNNYLSGSTVGKCTINFLYNLKELHLKNNKIYNFSLFMKNIYNLKLLEKLDVSENILMSLEENLETYKFPLLPSLRKINISNSNFSILLQKKYSQVQNVNTYEVDRKDGVTILFKLEQ